MGGIVAGPLGALMPFAELAEVATEMSRRLRGVWSSRSPLLLFAIKSALAAGLSWEIVVSLLGEGAAALAVVSAVIVVQATTCQTPPKRLHPILAPTPP